MQHAHCGFSLSIIKYDIVSVLYDSLEVGLMPKGGSTVLGHDSSRPIGIYLLLYVPLIVAAQPSKLVNKVSKLFMAQETYVFTKYYYNFHSTEVINSILGVSESAILIILSIHPAL